MIYKSIKKCRACESTDLTKVVDLGKQYLQGVFLKSTNPHSSSVKIPMILALCGSCSLLQTMHTVSPKLLYTSYWYRSRTTKTMKNHLKEIAHEALTVFGKTSAKILDIGANDGTLLNYYPKAVRKVGIEPSNAIKETTGEIEIINDFFPSQKILKRLKGRSFDIITSVAVFYDIDDPVSFARHVKKLLSPEGIWIFEVFYMPELLKKNCYDMICHEHLSYFSLHVLQIILKKTGMKLIKVQKNTINGSSIKCTATHYENSKYSKYRPVQAIKRILDQEKSLKLESKYTYFYYQKRIEKKRDELIATIQKLKKAGKTIHLYGASTKGNTVLQFCQFNNEIIEAAADKNPEKHDALTLGTNIPIISEASSRKMKPDYYLVLPWAFRNEFIKRERNILATTNMIFPFPKIEIVRS